MQWGLCDNLSESVFIINVPIYKKHLLFLLQASET